MVSFKLGGLRVLQAAAFIASVSARCTPCNASDKLLRLLRAQDQSEVTPLCASFLGASTSTAEVTVTPTVTASETSTVVITELSTTIEGYITVTESASVSAPALITAVEIAKRSVEYPEWLATTYNPSRLSSACECLSIAPSAATVTVTATAEAITVTEAAVVTETTTSVLSTIGVVTVTETPPTGPVTIRAKIAVHRKSTGERVGYIYDSAGPAVANDGRALTYDFTVPGGTTTANQLRIAVRGAIVALGFEAPAARGIRQAYGSVISNTPTPPGSLPVENRSEVYATDIWTVNTETQVIGWEWIDSEGVHTSTSLSLYRVGGRLYPVGNAALFNAAFGSASPSSRYEVELRYEVVA